MLDFTPVNEKITSLCIRVGNRSFTVVSAYSPISSAEYPGLLVFLEGVLDGPLTWDYVVLLGDFNAHGDDDSDDIGMNSLPDLDQGIFLLLDICVSHRLSITNTMFKLGGVTSAHGTRMP